MKINREAKKSREQHHIMKVGIEKLLTDDFHRKQYEKYKQINGQYGPIKGLEADPSYVVGKNYPNELARILDQECRDKPRRKKLSTH